MSRIFVVVVFFIAITIIAWGRMQVHQAVTGLESRLRMVSNEAKAAQTRWEERWLRAQDEITEKEAQLQSFRESIPELGKRHRQEVADLESLLSDARRATAEALDAHGRANNKQMLALTIMGGVCIFAALGYLRLWYRLRQL